MPELLKPLFSPLTETQKEPDYVAIPPFPDIVPPSVSIGVGIDPSLVPPLPIDPNELNPDSWYSEGAIDGRYDWDDGLLQVPVAGPPGTPCEIIRVHSGTCQRTVEFTAESVNGKPNVPGSYTNNSNETRARKVIWPMTPAIDGNGNQIYRLSGAYTYFLRYAPADSDYLSAGTVQYSTVQAVQNNVTPDQFNPALNDSSSSVPAAYLP